LAAGVFLRGAVDASVAEFRQPELVDDRGERVVVQPAVGDAGPGRRLWRQNAGAVPADDVRRLVGRAVAAAGARRAARDALAGPRAAHVGAVGAARALLLHALLAARARRARGRRRPRAGTRVRAALRRAAAAHRVGARRRRARRAPPRARHRPR